MPFEATPPMRWPKRADQAGGEPANLPTSVHAARTGLRRGEDQGHWEARQRLAINHLDYHSTQTVNLAWAARDPREGVHHTNMGQQYSSPGRLLGDQAHRVRIGDQGTDETRAISARLR